MTRNFSELRDEARRCVEVADQTVDDKVAAALLAYACELEQRAKLIESTQKRVRTRRHDAGETREGEPTPY